MQARIAGAIVVAFGLAITGQSHAQDKKAKEPAPVTKVLLENDRVRVTETTFKPGDVSRVERKARTNYILTDGKLERTTKDGKNTVYERKKGTALWLEADNDVVRNIGSSNYVVIGVTMK